MKADTSGAADRITAQYRRAKSVHWLTSPCAVVEIFV